LDRLRRRGDRRGRDQRRALCRSPQISLRARRRAPAVERQPRDPVPGRRRPHRLPLVVFILGVVFTDKAREQPSTGSAGLASAKVEPLQIKATGQQWLWRYEYPNGAFSYYKLVVPVDTAVELDLVSTDVVHTWNVPDLAGKHDAVPGKTNHLAFRADDEGEFGGEAATLSGQAYASMRTEVDVVSPQAYEEFLKQQKSDIDAAQERVVGLIENGEVP